MVNLQGFLMCMEYAITMHVRQISISLCVTLLLSTCLLHDGIRLSAFFSYLLFTLEHSDAIPPLVLRKQGIERILLKCQLTLWLYLYLAYVVSRSQ